MTVRAQPDLRPRVLARRSARTMEELREAREAKVARWATMLEEGVYPTRAALARAEGVSRAAVTKALATLLAT